MFVFVYGTLKRGFCNHFVMGNSRFIEKVITKNKYLMFIDKFGGFPYILDLYNDGLQIKGEMFDVPAERIDFLDEFEGVPDLYHRKEIEVLTSAGEQKAFAYFYSKEIILFDKNPIDEFNS